ncbi:MAG: patatin-like phospholipase family protein, partial [Zavarzinella sp.]|nr:patatin-like phospholipase family protein [Zavarzinella sp.]
MPDTDPPKFEDAAQAYELDRVAERRSRVHSPRDKEGRPTVGAEAWKLPKDDAGKYEPLRADLVGLAFSGGGIRSATFNLGILQALGRLKLLTRLDYLSTVSGGGYIGGWLAAWIRRADEPGPPSRPKWTAVEAVQSHLDPRTNRMKVGDPHAGPGTESEPETVHHLRAHSRYLAPRFGLFSVDFWTLIAIYVRNLFINLLVVAPAALLLALTARVVVAAFARLAPGSPLLGWVLFGAFVVLLLGAHVAVRR